MRATCKEFPFWEKATKLSRRGSFVVRGRVPQGGLQSAGAHLRDSRAGRRPAFQGSFTVATGNESSVPPSGENPNWKEGFKRGRSRGMIVVSGAAPQRAAPEKPNGEDRRLSSRLASQRPPAGGLHFLFATWLAAAAAGGSVAIQSSGVRTFPAIKSSSRRCTTIALSGRSICSPRVCCGNRTIRTGR
jgi:hypothetical protein